MKSKKNQKKINIAFYTLNLKSSGVLKIISTLSLSLQDQYSIHILVSDSQPKDFELSFELGGTIHFFNIFDPEKRNFFNRMYKNYLRKKLLKKYKYDNDIDITLTFSENPNIHNVITKCDDKTIISVHSFTSRNIIDGMKSKFYTFFYRFMIKKYFNKADRVVTVSNGVKHDLVSQFNINENIIEVLYNPHNIDRIINLSKEVIATEVNLLFKDNFTILNIGNINVAKGHWNLIRSFSLVKKQIPNASLIIIGDSDLEMGFFIKKLISDLNLDDSVNLLGYQKNPYKFLKLADIFTFSSIYEGFGISIVEALACSIPVISTDCKSGPREILAPSTDYKKATDTIEYAEYGILTPASNEEMLDATVPITSKEKLLAEAMIKLCSDKEMRNSYSRKGLQRALDFGIDKTIQNYDNLFKEILSK
ncbi:MAG: glycosyltransferase [Candidatus Delongbacteria bacterium]|jgi:glycosyltransferase involved in cell wall biosynthesis|nr:glycosyltransferase [Candidatus Delongbacteria bacterium]